MGKTVRLLLAMLLGLLLAVPVQAAEADFEGYVVKLTESAPRLLSAESPLGLVVVDTLEEAESIPAEYVEYIEPNYLVELLDDAAQPNDSYYADYQWGVQAIGGLSAWQKGLTGAGVKVGFVDSGINGVHEDLNPQTITGVNYNADGLDYGVDTYGHGTFAAGIVAAQTGNETGLAGLAPQAELQIYRVFSKKSATMDQVAEAIAQAVADGCRILNLSLGTTSDSNTLRQAVQGALDAGTVVIAAVGNNGTDTVMYPAAYEGVIGVGSVGPELEVSSFSQKNSTVFVTAPGEQIPGLGYTAPDSYRLELTSSDNRGTSYAAPVITAMAAIALGYEEDITADGLRYLLETTSTDRGDPGYDTSYGHGVVDMEAYLAELTRSFSIEYVLSGGTLSEAAPTAYQVTDGDLALPVPVREGYWFDGWYTDEGLTQPIAAIPAGSLGDMTVYAGWQESYTGLTGYENSMVYYGTETDGLVIAAAYDVLGRLTGTTLTAVAAGEGSVTAAAVPEGGTMRVFLLAPKSYAPLCIPLIR